MNGDIGKIPSGAGYAASPEPQAPCTPNVNDYSTLNGVVEPYSDGPTPLGGSVIEAAAASEPALTSPSGLPLDQLKQMLSSQLEYYFSRENLANDTYLVSQMDNDQYVPIWTVANFNQVKKLSKDIKLITEVLRESPNVQVDEEGIKVRPSHKRCIVILREIPDSTPLDDVKALFSGKGCPRLVSCEFAHNNSWYVTFENDEDAQKAYRFLREEVREFQGKPIMARIKAKPMNRLPIPPVVPGMAPMKNGFRAPPSTASAAATPAFDPTAAYPTTPPRYLFNGSTLPSTVNYGNPVQIYTFQQQPYYPSMLPPPWPPTSPAYFEFGSVFSVNGLAPQPFAKSQGSRYVTGTRNTRNKRSEHRSSVSETSSSRSYISNKGNGKGSECHLSHAGTVATSKSLYSQRDMMQESEDHIARLSEPSVASKDAVRRRRKDEESPRVSNSPGPVAAAARGPQFDLEDDAFPPLPGLEPATQPLPATIAEPLPEIVPPTVVAQSHRENRLSDVVKGTAKTKPSPSCNSSTSISSCKDKETGSPRPHSASPPLSAPSHVTPPLPTPPLTPDKTVPLPAAVAVKCCTADKSTKTDDMVVNGAGSEVVVSASDTNTDNTPLVPQQFDCPKKSYAQVAQHPKEKLSAERDRTDKLTVTTSSEDDKKEFASGQMSPRDSLPGAHTAARPAGMGRGSTRSVQDRRRRDSSLRFSMRTQSPK